MEQESAEAKKRLEIQSAQREEDLKGEYARREQERVHYWEGLVGQLRAEKESIKNMIVAREEAFPG